AGEGGVWGGRWLSGAWIARPRASRLGGRLLTQDRGALLTTGPGEGSSGTPPMRRTSFEPTESPQSSTGNSTKLREASATSADELQARPVGSPSTTTTSRGW